MKKYKIQRNYTKLGAFLMQKRKASGLTQKEIADKLGYSSAQFISNFERGIAAPPVNKTKNLLKLLKMNADDAKQVVNHYVEVYQKELTKTIR